MANGLPLNNLINISINLSPLAAQGADLNNLLIFGASNVIDTNERYRTYGSIAAVASDFGINAPEYLAALPYFAQTPQPRRLSIARWAKTATQARLRGGALSPTQQAIANFTVVTSGGFQITVDGVVKSLTGLNFSAQTNLNGVAAVIDTALVGGSVTWNGTQFVVQSDTTGVTSTLTYATAPVSGTDISTLLGLTNTLASAPVAGIAAEQPVEAYAIALDRFPRVFTGFSFADTSITDSQYIAVATLNEANSRHILGVTTQSPQALDVTITTDLGSALKALKLNYTFTTYSSSNAYAANSIFGRFLTTNFNANNTVITLMYKQQPVIAAENLSLTQANALKSKNINVFVQYENDTAITQYGTVCSGLFIDSIYNLIAFRNDLETGLYNEFLQTPTKIAQTDQGTQILVTRATTICERYANNGYIGRGLQWNSGGFGTLQQGDILIKGYYIYAPPIVTQSQESREARMSVPIQIALKEAGAIHTVDIIVNVNR